MNTKAQEPTLQDLADFNFGAIISKDQVKEMERHAQEQGISRRMALLLAASSKADLVESQGKTKGFRGNDWLDLYEQFEGFIEHLKGQIEFAEAARNRSLCMAATMLPTAE